MSSLIFNPSNVGNGSVTLNIFGDDKQYNINLPKTNATLIGSVNGKIANENGSVTIDVGVKTVNGVTPDSKGNVTVKVQSIASNSDVISGTDNTKMMTPLRTKESVQQFSPNDYVTNLSVSGQTVTFNKKDGTSGSIITQDTKYTHPNSGVKAGTYNSVTVNEQGHVTGGSNVNYTKTVEGVSPDDNGNVGLGLHSVAKSGNYNELNNRPNLHAVATNGDYNSLNNKPYIPSSIGSPNINYFATSSTTRFVAPCNCTAFIDINKNWGDGIYYILINGVTFGIWGGGNSLRHNTISNAIVLKKGDVVEPSSMNYIYVGYFSWE